MSSSIEIKSQLLEMMKVELNQKRTHLLEALNSAKQARDSENKSSAGDKYETGRAMMQIDIDNYQGQLNKIDQKLNEIGKIPLKPSSHVTYGSLVNTSSGLYFIAMAAGVLELHKQKYFCVSGAAPIANALMYKKANDYIHFRDKKIKILAID